MRVAVFLANLSGGGAERVMVQLVRALGGLGVSVEVVAADAVGPYAAPLRELVPLTSLGGGGVARNVVPLARWLQRHRPDVLVTALDHANVACVAARRLARVPTAVVLTHHNSLSQLEFSTLAWKDKLVRLSARLAYRDADAVVAVSQGVAAELVAQLGLPASKVHCIYNPVLSPALLDLADAPLDHPWFGPGQPPVLLAVGRVSWEKDFGALIEAFAGVRQRRPVRLLILGEGDQRPALEAAVLAHGVADDVALPGYDPNPYRYIRRAAALVLSSRYEGLPTVLIEALAIGTPVVATDCETGPREILHGGKLGRLVPPRDPAALADAIGATLDAPFAVPAAAALLPYQQDEAGARYLRLFEAVVAPRQRTNT